MMRGRSIGEEAAAVAGRRLPWLGGSVERRQVVAEELAEQAVVVVRVVELPHPGIDDAPPIEVAGGQADGNLLIGEIAGQETVFPRFLLDIGAGLQAVLQLRIRLLGLQREKPSPTVSKRSFFAFGAARSQVCSDVAPRAKATLGSFSCSTVWIGESFSTMKTLPTTT